MRYWWSNQKLTYSREVGGGYFWCRQRKSNGTKNPFYDAVRLLRAGDVVFAYCRGRIRAAGLVLSPAEEAPDPARGDRDDAPGTLGWLARVAWLELKNPPRPMNHFEALKPLLPKNYSPLSPEGRGGQGGRLMPLPQALAMALAQIAGGMAEGLPQQAGAAPASQTRGKQLPLAFQTQTENRKEETP